jgi:hypothetical protein
MHACFRERESASESERERERVKARERERETWIRVNADPLHTRIVPTMAATHCCNSLLFFLEKLGRATCGAFW